MPNWAYVTYKCIGDAKDIKRLYEILEDIDTGIPNDFGRWWLGNLVTKLGGDWNQYRCRGEIINYRRESDTVLMIYQNTAWGEQEGVRKIIEEKLPSVEVYFQEEESGCELYATNSFEHFPERYLLDSYNEPAYYATIEGAAEDVSEIVGHKVDPNVEAINQALDDYLEEHGSDDVWYSFHEFVKATDE